MIIMAITVICGCWQNEEIGEAEFCKYHDNLAAAEEMTENTIEDDLKVVLRKMALLQEQMAQISAADYFSEEVEDIESV